MNKEDILVGFAKQIGSLTQGFDDLKKHFENHLSDHKIDRIMQWFILALQVIVIMLLGYFKL